MIAANACRVLAAVGNLRDRTHRHVDVQRGERLLDDRRTARRDGLVGSIAHDRERRWPCLDDDGRAIVRGDRVLAGEQRDELARLVARDGERRFAHLRLRERGRLR